MDPLTTLATLYSESNDIARQAELAMRNGDRLHRDLADQLGRQWHQHESAIRQIEQLAPPIWQ